MPHLTAKSVFEVRIQCTDARDVDHHQMQESNRWSCYRRFKFSRRHDHWTGVELCIHQGYFVV